LQAEKASFYLFVAPAQLASHHVDASFLLISLDSHLTGELIFINILVLNQAGKIVQYRREVILDVKRKP